LTLEKPPRPVAQYHERNTMKEKILKWLLKELVEKYGKDKLTKLIKEIREILDAAEASMKLGA
jgi:hypothetical protein